MKTNIHFYHIPLLFLFLFFFSFDPAFCFLECEMFQTNVVEKVAYFVSSNFFFVVCSKILAFMR